MDVIYRPFSEPITQQANVRDAGLEMSRMVHDLTEKIINLWWSCPASYPGFRRTYSQAEQIKNEKKLDEMSKGLVFELKRLPPPGPQRETWMDHLRPGLVGFAQSILDIRESQVEFIESSGMIAATQEFARMARQFAPAISAEDIYQAGRNVMTAAFIQLLMGLPVKVTSSIFAYSMLYPYTDNYLDDRAVPSQTKAAFIKRFERRLKGENVEPANQYEEDICKLVGLIEMQWDRDSHPEVYASLLAIHSAQVRSLSLVAPGFAPYQKDVLGISFEKGGTSVLADGYLVAGKLTSSQARYLFGYGAFTQLMDDLEDLESDLKDGQLTIFSQALSHWKLDGVTNQFLHFGRNLFGDLEAFHSADTDRLQELIASCLDPILIDIVGREAAHYSPSYLRRIENSFPFRFSVLKKQRERLERQQSNLGRLIEAML